MKARTKNAGRQNIKTFTENGFTAIIEMTKGRYSVDILEACSTMDDVQRCASMGDFRIVRYDLPTA